MALATAEQTNAAKFHHVCRILDEYERAPSMIIPILQKVQEEYRYLPEEVLLFIATSLGMSPAKIYGIATFYSHFSLVPKGKYVIKVCDGTACHVRGSGKLINVIRGHLSLSEGKNTTDDMLFTLETVSCLGACGLAPVVVVNEQVYGQMGPEKTRELIEKIREEENGAH
jgi:NADH-quinone oxidoreductase subunit E